MTPHRFAALLRSLPTQNPEMPKPAGEGGLANIQPELEETGAGLDNRTIPYLPRV
jgi:hypothetical protein